MQQADAALRTQDTVTHGIASDHHGALSHCLVLSTGHLHRHVLQRDGAHGFLGEAQTEAVSDGAGVALLVLEVPKETYGKSTVPKWNFHKILINKNGKVEDTFASFTGPLSNKIIKKLEKIL